MRDVVVALAMRTPVGKAPRGTFRQTRPDDLCAAVIRAILERAPKLEPGRTAPRAPPTVTEVQTGPFCFWKFWNVPEPAVPGGASAPPDRL